MVQATFLGLDRSNIKLLNLDKHINGKTGNKVPIARFTSQCAQFSLHCRRLAACCREAAANHHNGAGFAWRHCGSCVLIVTSLACSDFSYVGTSWQTCSADCERTHSSQADRESVRRLLARKRISMTANRRPQMCVLDPLRAAISTRALASRFRRSRRFGCSWATCLRDDPTSARFADSSLLELMRCSTSQRSAGEERSAEGATQLRYFDSSREYSLSRKETCLVTRSAR